MRQPVAPHVMPLQSVDAGMGLQDLYLCIQVPVHRYSLIAIVLKSLAESQA